MRLQFNLLPDVKQEYLKTERTKKTVIMVAFAASAVSLFLLLLMMTNVYVINKKKLNDADKDVKKYSDQLKAIPNLDRVLTVQNQLKSVASLHQSKHVTSRLYTYLPQITPTNVCLGKVSLDLAGSSLILEGTTDTLKSVNTYVDTLKFTTYQLSGQETKTKAFPTVTESQFGLSQGGGVGGQTTTCAGKPANASYQLSVQFDPVLFSNSSKVTLTVPPGLSTTRSVLDDPNNALFTGQPTPAKASNQSSNSQAGGR
jgi:Tfp pilus assembly protein PilN